MVKEDCLGECIEVGEGLFGLKACILKWTCLYKGMKLCQQSSIGLTSHDNGETWRQAFFILNNYAHPPTLLHL